MIRTTTLIAVLAVAFTACGTKKSTPPTWLSGKWGAHVEEKVGGSAMMLEVLPDGRFSAKFLERNDIQIDVQAILKGTWQWESGKLVLAGEITQQAAGMAGQPSRNIPHQKGEIVWVLLADEASKSLRPEEREFPRAGVPGVITLSKKIQLKKTEF